MMNMLELKTTTDCLEEAKKVLAQAKTVTDRESHVALWDYKVDVLRAVNSALESGAFVGEARNELKAAQHLLYKAEDVAGKRAIQHSN